MHYTSFEINTRPYASSLFPKGQRKALGENERHFEQRKTRCLGIPVYHLFFCEKLNFQQRDFRDVHANSDNPWSDRESVFSLRDSKPKIIDMGQGQMENRLKREKGKKRRETGI